MEQEQTSLKTDLDKKSKSNLKIWQYIILGLVLLFGILEIIVWLSPRYDCLGCIIVAVLLFGLQILFALIGMILSIIGIIKAKKVQEYTNLKSNIIFLILYVVTPFFIWYINYLITDNFQK